MAEQSESNYTSSSTSTATTAGNDSLSASANEQAHYTDVAIPPQLPRGGLYAPNVSGSALPDDDSIAGIVARLMSPPSYFYNDDRQTITITINWAVGVAGPERFERRGTDGRYFLSGGDELEEQGGAAGLSSEILDWLKYGEETLTLPVEHFL